MRVGSSLQRSRSPDLKSRAKFTRRRFACLTPRAGRVSNRIRMKTALISGAVVVLAASLIASQQIEQVGSSAASTASRWWSPGDGATLAAYVTYPNAQGQLGI